MQRVGNATATPGGWSSQGDTTESSAVISNVPDTTGLYVGDYISFNAGFDETLGSRLRVVSLTLTTITVDRAANATEASIAIASLANMYTDGVVDLVARTILNSKYMNLLQEEIAQLIEKAGYESLDEADTLQLYKAIALKAGEFDVRTPAFRAPAFTTRVKSAVVSDADTIGEVQRSSTLFTFDVLQVHTSKLVLNALSGVTPNDWFGVNALVVYESGGETNSAKFEFLIPTFTDNGYSIFAGGLRFLLDVGHIGERAWSPLYIYDKETGIDESKQDSAAYYFPPCLIIFKDGTGVYKIKIRNINAILPMTNIKLYLELINANPFTVGEIS